MIRAMVAEDAESVAALVRAAFGAIAVPLDPAPSALRVTTEDVAAALQEGGGAVWDKGGVHGCVLWQPRTAGLLLKRLAVRPGWQGRGIGRALICGAEAEARRRGVAVLQLEVRLTLPGNRALFASCGFRDVALRAHAGRAAPTYAEAEKRLAADGDFGLDGLER